MIYSDLEDLCEELHRERMTLLGSKGRDYATDDVLSNFKRVSALCSILGIYPHTSAMDCALFLAVLKLDRWCNLKGRTAENESVRDTVRDLHNYIDLAYALMQ